MSHFKKFKYFGLFFNLITAEEDTLFAAFYPPPYGSGELVFGGGSDNIYRLVLKLS